MAASFFINAGMPKSGTTALLSLQNALVQAALPENGIDTLRQVIPWGYAEVINEETAERLIQVAEKHGPFVVKTHREPTHATRRLIQDGLAKATVSYRDIRDAVLSALDHGDRYRSGKDPNGAFAHLKTVADAIELHRSSVRNWRQWRDFGECLLVKYDDLMKDRSACAHAVASYFELDIASSEIDRLVREHHAASPTMQNYNVGTLDRWRNDMSTQDLTLCESAYATDIVSMGYQLSGLKLQLDAP